MQYNKSEKYGDGYFTKTLPPNHNPMIGLIKADTLSNVRDGLCTLRELAELPDFEPSERTMVGFHFLMTCMVNALSFEIENRE